MLYDDKKWDKEIIVVDEVGKIMHLAADYLETHRWGQGDFVLANGAVCLMGALIKIETGEVHSMEYYDETLGVDPEEVCVNAGRALIRVQAYLQTLRSTYRFIDPYIWNDDWKRKKSEVIAVLREAATFK